MKPIVKLDRTLVAVEAEQQVHMMLELTAPPAPAARRAPIDVVAVIDRSGSMSGQPLEAVIAAVNLLFRLVGDDDRIAVVTFDDHVDLALPLAHHDTDTAWQALRRVRSGGSTNLSGGWLKAMEILAANGRAEALKRIVVLTDGMANLGITSHDSLSGLCSAAKAQAITTTMIGFGDGYEETLLAAMADAGGGNDYWCAGADQAAQVFGDEFTGLTSVVAQNISVEVRPADPSARFRVLNEYPITVVDGGLQVALGDAYGDERRRVVAVFDVNPGPKAGPYRIADLVIRWASTVGEIALHTVTVPVMVGAGDAALADATPLDEEVVEQVNVLRVASLRKQAMQAERAGRREDAIGALEQAMPLLVSAGAPSNEIDEMHDDLRRMRRGDWSERDMKRQFSSMRSTQKGRRARYDHSAQTDTKRPQS
ncbi:MAG: VWA domain-containing protein [Acidimicrobiaceae bacterium]|nr:VWA domain-containing protein [Acidimicrobiaceae bacterium]